MKNHLLQILVSFILTLQIFADIDDYGSEDPPPPNLSENFGTAKMAIQNAPNPLVVMTNVNVNPVIISL